MSRTEIGLRILALGLAPAFLGACGLRVSSTLAGNEDAGTPPAKVCTAGQEFACTCSGGEPGVQICAPDGEGYEACECTVGISPPPYEDASPPTYEDAGMIEDAGSSSATWPSPPSQGTAPSPNATTFAVHHVHLGDELDSTGDPDWYQYGYNLDGKFTTSTSADVCTLYKNANSTNQIDGPGGIDNSFGENFVPLLSAVVANVSASQDNEITSGSYSWIYYVEGLSGDPTQSSVGLFGGEFLGLPFAQAPNAVGAIPTFTATDNWPVDQSMVTSTINPGGLLAMPATSTSEFSGAYVTSGEFVSGAPLSLQLVIALDGQLLKLPLQHAVITFNTASSTHASGGIVAGIIAAQDLVNAMQGIAGAISTSLCSAATFAQIATSIEQAADIMTDGTNEAGIPCNGISVGIGFDADEMGRLRSRGRSRRSPTLAPGGRRSRAGAVLDLRVPRARRLRAAPPPSARAPRTSSRAAAAPSP